MKKFENPDMIVTLLKSQDILCAASTTPEATELPENDPIG